MVARTWHLILPQVVAIHGPLAYWQFHPLWKFVRTTTTLIVPMVSWRPGWLWEILTGTLVAPFLVDRPDSRLRIVTGKPVQHHRKPVLFFAVAWDSNILTGHCEWGRY